MGQTSTLAVLNMESPRVQLSHWRSVRLCLRGFFNTRVVCPIPKSIVKNYMYRSPKKRQFHRMRNELAEQLHHSFFNFCSFSIDTVCKMYVREVCILGT